MNLRSAKRPNIQGKLDLPVAVPGEAQEPRREGVESLPTAREPESPASIDRTMEEICEWKNLKEAMWRVKANKGSAGIDGMTVDELPDYAKLLGVREQLLSGTYAPQPVMQVLQRQWDQTFSDSSYGFRPGRSTHQAVAQAQQYIAAGYGWVVDLDLEKFFDRVHHDKLMGQIAKRIRDKRLLRLIRAFLNAGVMENGLVSPSVEGTPQGGPLSPLLSNIVLDELDRELERRGHRFVRYADDSNIYVRSERAGQRVMASIRRFIIERLQLRVNEKKSAVARPQERKFLGFTFTEGPAVRRRIAPEAVARFKQRIREITRQAKSVSLETTMATLAPYMRGWRGYFGFCQTPDLLIRLTGWVRPPLRAALWRQWKTSRRRRAMLLQLGVHGRLAADTAVSGRGPWHLAHSQAVCFALSNAFFRDRGLPSLFGQR